MDKILFNSVTVKQAELFISSAPHALLITGGRGSGKTFLAEYIIAKVMHAENLANHPYVRTITPINQTVGIDAVRDITSFLGRKTTGNAAIRRAVIISDADYMTTEAQNALLKSLEEPPEDTMIVLTASDITNLKTTVLSRVQVLRVEPLSLQRAQKILSPHYEINSITKAFHISGGRASLMIAVLDQKADHPLIAAIEKSKMILKQTSYERMISIENLVKDKEQLKLLIEGMQRVVRSALIQSAAKNNKAYASRLLRLSEIIQLSDEALHKNATAKLVLCHLFLQM